MHALCVVVAKTPARVTQIINDKCESGDWDYAAVGGRYEKIIPVAHRTKDPWPRFTWGNTHEDYPPNGFPFGEQLENNPHCKYVSGARIRNINYEEIDRIAARNLININSPYSYIFDLGDYASEEFIVEESGIGRYLDFITNPAHSYYYIAVVDYHF